MKEHFSDIPEFRKTQYLLNWCFLADVTKKLNKLNLKLQCEEKLITDCYEDVQAFMIKLRLYQSQLKPKNAVRF